MPLSYKSKSQSRAEAEGPVNAYSNACASATDAMHTWHRQIANLKEGSCVDCIYIALTSGVVHLSGFSVMLLSFLALRLGSKLTDVDFITMAIAASRLLLRLMISLKITFASSLIKALVICVSPLVELLPDAKEYSLGTSASRVINGAMTSSEAWWTIFISTCVALSRN